MRNYAQPEVAVFFSAIAELRFTLLNSSLRSLLRSNVRIGTNAGTLPL